MIPSEQPKTNQDPVQTTPGFSEPMQATATNTMLSNQSPQTSKPGTSSKMNSDSQGEGKKPTAEIPKVETTTECKPQSNDQNTLPLTGMNPTLSRALLGSLIGATVGLVGGALAGRKTTQGLNHAKQGVGQALKTMGAGLGQTGKGVGEALKSVAEGVTYAVVGGTTEVAQDITEGVKQVGNTTAEVMESAKQSVTQTVQSTTQSLQNMGDSIQESTEQAKQSVKESVESDQPVCTEKTIAVNYTPEIAPIPESDENFEVMAQEVQVSPDPMVNTGNYDAGLDNVTPSSEAVETSDVEMNSF